MALQKDLLLSPDLSIPAVGYGTWRLEGLEETAAAVRAAIAEGYRLIDTAWYYGNIDGAGLGLRTSARAREQLLFTDKLWPSKMGYSSAIAACKSDLRAAGLDYFDIYLIHWPISKDHKEDWEPFLQETWRGLIELKKQGCVRSIGVSNFHERHFAPLREFDEQPALNQLESHPGYPNEDAVRYCLSRGVAVQAWRPLMKGGLSHPVLLSLAQKHGKSPAQICLRWNIERGVAVLAKSTHLARMRENLSLFDFSLDESDMLALRALERIGSFGFVPDDAPY